MFCQTHNTSTAYSASLKELLRRKISALEQRLLHQATSITDGNHQHGDDEDDGDVHHDGQRDGNNNHHDDSHHDSETGGHENQRSLHRSQDRRMTRDELDKVLKQLTHGARSNTGDHVHHFTDYEVS